eukprot:CAMPEP_0201683268 /NCGR_PEP_ID=MMETSP0494-20130426/52041_1 /ASSEMBLY_ACC=CAM_ASM_000839 /TAXON_ID=420259 /ORGANISM="Thalassiosira gravida, Strain GMp14c1" /LENGTH=252 /DNA_ID=CAMNT_0048167043 /DNA_START=72 /DNA_END=830 /DNA_ORIENTATION=-
MSVWKGYDGSLKAAIASMRPKKNHAKTRTDSKVDIYQERPSEATVFKSTKESPKSPSLQHRKKRALDKTGDKQSQQPNIDDFAPKIVWVCPSSKAMFAKKKKCEKHIKACNFGSGKQIKPKLMYVYEGCNKMFETSEECRSHMKGCRADSIATDKTSDKQSEQPNINDFPPKLVWVCPSSKAMFAKKKMCEKHIKSCSFGSEKQIKPKLMYVYEGCNKMFETSEECRSHMKGCRVDLIAMDAVGKNAKKKKA